MFSLVFCLWLHGLRLRAASSPVILPGLPWPQGYVFVNFIYSIINILLPMSNNPGLQGHDDENYPLSLLHADASPDLILLERYKVTDAMLSH